MFGKLGARGGFGSLGGMAKRTQSGSTLPPNVNRIPLAARTDFTNGLWTAQQVTKNVNGYTETATTNVHGFSTTLMSASANTEYELFVDVDVSAGQPWMHMDCIENTFASNAFAYYNISGLSVDPSDDVSGDFTNLITSCELLANGKTRIKIKFTTGPSTTGIYWNIRSATGAFGGNYLGSIAKSVVLENPFFYDPLV